LLSNKKNKDFSELHKFCFAIATTIISELILNSIKAYAKFITTKKTIIVEISTKNLNMIVIVFLIFSTICITKYINKSNN